MLSKCSCIAGRKDTMARIVSADFPEEALRVLVRADQKGE
jgi:hypothetical protein